MIYTRAGRLMAIDTVLGPDVLLRERLEIEEGIDRLVTLQARVRAQHDEVRPDEIVGTADLSLTLADGSQRVWNGLVTELHEGPIVTRGTRQTARPDLIDSSSVNEIDRMVVIPGNIGNTQESSLEIKSPNGGTTENRFES